VKSPIVLAIGLAVIGLVMAACAPQASPPPTQALVTTPGPASFPLAVTDDLGRHVTIASAPKRIVSLAPSNTEILFAVGAGDQVVGLTKYCSYPPEASAGRTVIGGFTANSVSVEKILALQPDLVVAAGSSHRSVIEALEQAHVTILALDAQNLDGIYKNILLAGQVTGHTSQAGKLVDDMKRRVAAVSAKVQTIPAGERPKVFYEVWDEPLMTAGPATFIHQVIELAGGSNIFADAAEEYPRVSPEVVIERNPDVILGPSSHGDALVASKIAARPGWRPIRAVRQGRVAIVDGDLISRAGPRIVDALESVAKLLYPNRFD
jgi:iron complex transport system substrate-binding protein